MNFAKLSISAVLAFSGAVLFADISGIVTSYNVKHSNGVYSLDNKKSSYAALKWQTCVKAEKYYMLEFRVSSKKQAEVKLDMQGFQDSVYNVLNKYAAAPGSGLYRAYFYAPATAGLSFRLFSGDSIRLSDLKFQELSTVDLKHIETKGLASQFYCLRKENGAKIETVADKDSLEGGHAIRYTLLTAGGPSLDSRNFPLLPNTEYELSFWCKGPAGLTILAHVNGWASKRKHWYISRNFKLANDEYQLYKINFRTPEDVDRILGRGHLNIFLKTANASIDIKGLSLVMKSAEK